MRLLKNSLAILLCLGTCFSINAIAQDNNQAQLETSTPPAEGPLTADQIQPFNMSQAAAALAPATQALPAAPASVTPATQVPSPPTIVPPVSAQPVPGLPAAAPTPTPANAPTTPVQH